MHPTFYVKYPNGKILVLEESLYHAIKAVEQHFGEELEIESCGDISGLWGVEIETGMTLFQGYSFEPCDGFYDHIEEVHGGDYSTPDIDHAESGVLRGINGERIGTYVACRSCNILRIRLFASSPDPKFDFLFNVR